MSLSILRSRKRRIANGYEVSGIAQWSTTDLTGELKCELGTVEDIQLKSIGAGNSLVTAVNSECRTVSASAKVNIVFPHAGTVSAARFVVTTTVATDAANIWTVGLVNVGAAGAGTAAIVNIATAANSNTATTGSAFTALIPRALTLGSAADLVVAAGDVGVWTFTKAASAANLVDLSLQVLLTHGQAENLYVDETVVSDGVINRPAAGTLTIVRAGHAVTSGQKFAFRYIGH
jgi:hypothetical protein